VPAEVEELPLVGTPDGGKKHDLTAQIRRPEEAIRALTDHLSSKNIKVAISINQVGLEIRALDVDVNDESICIWVDSRTFQFKLPPTESVLITIEGHDPLKCVYTGCWGRFKSAPDWAFVMFLRDGRTMPAPP
jgi:hypothetical protein